MRVYKRGLSVKCVINLNDDSNFQYAKEEEGKYKCMSAPVSSNWKSEELGFHVERLLPKAFSCPYHLHEKEEELFLVIDGSAYVRQDGEFYVVNKGDLILFKKGSAHQFYNHTNSDFKFLALSNKAPDEIVHYPDSNKKWNRTKKELTQNGESVENYWKDEESPEKFWPKEIIST